MKTVVLLVLVAAAATASPQPRRPPAIEELILLPSDEFDSGRESWFGSIPQWFNFFNFNTAIRDFMASMNPFGNIDELVNKGNTTSETQVVNGTLITRNVTTYVDKDTGTVVHVSSVDIRPSEKTPDEVEEVTSPASKDPESTEAIDTNPPEDFADADIDTPAKESNEISDDKKQVEEPIVLSARPVDYYAKRNYYHSNDIHNDVEVFADSEQGGELQNDLYVNTVLEEKIRQSGGMFQLDPDVELIDVSGGRVEDIFPNTQVQSKDWDLPEELLS